MIAKYNLHNLLTAGGDYQVLNSTKDRYFIECDNGYRMWVRKDFFESEHLSSAKQIASESEALAERVRGNALCHERRINNTVMMTKINDCDASESVKLIEQLREIMRVPEGESIVTHAKVLRALADAMIGLQK